MEDEYKNVRQLLLELYEFSDEDLGVKKIKYNSYIKALRKLAYKGCSKAQYDLAGHYEDIGFWGMPNPFSNTSKRLYWYTKSCDLNNAEACNALSSIYLEGAGCEKNVKKSLNFAEKAARIDSNSLYIKENYNNQLKLINSSILTNILLNIIGEEEICNLLKRSSLLTVEFRLNKEGNVILLSKIKKSKGFSKDIIFLLNKYFTDKKIKLVYNKISNRKIITVSFPKPLMLHYKEAYYENRTLSEIKYLKDRVLYFMLN